MELRGKQRDFMKDRPTLSGKESQLERNLVQGERVYSLCGRNVLDDSYGASTILTRER